MSDYAGVILGAVGAVVGFYFGGPTGAAWGWSIGSAAGGMYAQSQQVIPGPKIGEVQKQTSQEGGFRPIVYGRSNPISGNVIADSEPVIVKRRESQGKGGPKVESESAFRTYAVGFCEGEAVLLQAWRNGILVFDTEDPSMSPENVKFLEYASWYTGSFDQSASPDLEAIYGAGNAPYFRGTAYLSIHEEDVTDQRGAWSQWQVRVFRGAAKSYTTPPYPLFSEAGIGSYGRARSAQVFVNPSDSMGTEGIALDGDLQDILIRDTMPPEEMITGGVALDGDLRTILYRYTSTPEEMTTEGIALDGILHDTKINYISSPEEMTTSGIALDGSLA